MLIYVSCSDLDQEFYLEAVAIYIEKAPPRAIIQTKNEEFTFLIDEDTWDSEDDDNFYDNKHTFFNKMISHEVPILLATELDNREDVVMSLSLDSM